MGRRYPFQSLLHQGISLLVAAGHAPDGIGHPRFNPFFIRASVYWKRYKGILEKDGFKFQSLLHQGISLLAANFFSSLFAGGSEFQSLLHQGISLLDRVHDGNHGAVRPVSIPSSSGHQFTGCPSLGPEGPRHPCFNPFFIRASVYWQRSLGDALGCQTGFNPFFIRASVYCLRDDGVVDVLAQEVSIPSSSGHQFTAL